MSSQQSSQCPSHTDPAPSTPLPGTKIPRYRPANQVSRSHSNSTYDPTEDAKIYGPDHGLRLESPLENVESAWSYLPGGHHPILLGELIGDYEQYAVIHKLGTGGFANVWLCAVTDSKRPTYVAVKILQASLSGKNSREVENLNRLWNLSRTDPDIGKYCLLPLDEFEIHGPNGVHQCFVYPLAGPSVAELMHTVEDFHGLLRSLTRQAGEAMAALHRNGICHGDFRPANVLVRLEGLNGLPVDEVLELLGEPMITNILVAEHANPKACIPPYIVEPLQFDFLTIRKFASDELCVIDFGESFDAAHPPACGTGIPLHYAPPELAFANTCSKASDIFALAATMYHIRLGWKLFTVQEDRVDSALDMMVKQLGRFPEPLWSKWVNRWKDIQERAGKDSWDGERLDESRVRRAHIREYVGMKVGHVMAAPGKKQGGFHERLPEEERVLFEDLIYRMTENDPAKRPSIQEVLVHPWFFYGIDKNLTPSPVDAGIQLPQASPLSAPQPAMPDPADIPLPDDASILSSPSMIMLDTEEEEQVDSPSPSLAQAYPHPGTPPRSESPIEQIMSLEFDWTQEINAVRTSALAVSAWFTRMFGL
ncbi:kinase-like domain-containing protein [Aspergillus filifer]